jgi:translocation and assembly module TamB
LFAPDFPGPVVARGRIGIDAERLSIGLDASGPGGTAGRIAGTASTRDGKVDLALTGRTQAAALDTFIAPRSLSGPVTFDLALRGTPSLRSMSGRVSADAIDFADPDYRVSVTGISFDADIANSQARIRSAGQVRGGGTVGIEGTVGLGAAEAADLTVALESVRLRDPSLYETRVSGQFRFTGAPAGGGLLSGEVAVGETELRIPSAGLGALGFDADILHVADSAPVRETRRRAGIGTAVPETPGAASRRPVALDIGISAPRRIFVRGRGLDAELGGSLRVRGTSADVQPAGQFDLIRGRLDILGKRFEIDEGLVRLEGALTPYVRFAANSTNDGVTSTVTIEGPASQPVIAFTSSPPLPEEEVVAQLLFGRGLDGISAFQAAQLASAIATLSGRGGEGVVGRLRSSFGLDDLDVQTDTDGNIAVRAGKYISQNVYTDIAVGTDGTSEINLNLDLNAGLTVRGTLGSDGDTGIGIYYERDY